MFRSRISRRRCLTTITATLATAALTRTTYGARTPREVEAVDTVATQVISRSSDYHGWPTLVRRKNGELLVVCSGGRETHVCPFGRVELIRSRDEGTTWTWPRVILDGPIDDRDAGICETAKGSLLVTTFTSLAYEATLKSLSGERLDRWMSVHNRLDEAERRRELGVWMIRSTDGGTTWSERYRCLVNSPHGPVSLSDGRIMYAGIGLWDANRKVGVAVSSDDGVSWEWLADIPVRDGDDGKDYHELHLVECASGKLVVHIRNHNPANQGETLQTESTDGGRTWSTPHGIGVWGLPSHLMKDSLNRLVMSYGHRRPAFGNQVRFSDDEGDSWTEPLAVSADGAGGDLGYPSTVELENGDYYTVWYEKLADNPSAVLRGSRWRIPDR